MKTTILVLGLSFLSFFFSVLAKADTLVVTTESDDSTATYCNSIGDKTLGTCSLRGAVSEAASGDTVMVPAGTFCVGSQIYFEKSLTIIGAGSDETVIDGGNRHSSSTTPTTCTASEERIFYADGIGDPYDVVLSSLTIEGGYAGDDISGGGVYISSLNSVLIDDVIFQENTVFPSLFSNTGGGLSLFEINTITVKNTSIKSNTMEATGSQACGGGMMFQESPDVTLSNLEVTQNISDGGYGGGGMCSVNSTVAINDSNISFNEATTDEGGGIYVVGSTGSLTITDSTIDSNTASDNGGGIYFNNRSTNTITGSTVSNNTISSTSGSGGGIYTTGANLYLINSTISTNSAPGNGGGVYVTSVTTSSLIQNSTITLNTSGASGGGFYVNSSSTVQVFSTIVHGNTAATSSGSNCRRSTSSTITSLGYNLILTLSCNYTRYTTSPGADLSSSTYDPKLASLSDNGGPTKTHALGSTSNALNTGACSHATSTTVTTVTKDQRGYYHDDGSCDIGAYESGASYCGDGTEDTSFGEECDDGDTDDTDSCPTTCQDAECGDGLVLSGSEECDDGNTVDTDSCLSTCQVAVCGDGFILAGSEECDDGNAVDTDSCPSTCRIAECGDGFVLSGSEECDDGGVLDGDGCSSACTIESAGTTTGGSTGGSTSGGGSSSGSDTGGSSDPLTFVVTTTNDTLDTSLADGVCEDSTGECSLRAAVMEANSGVETDIYTIVLSDETYTLTIPGSEPDFNDASSGDLDISVNMEIEAPTNATIIGDGTSGIFSVYVSDLNISFKNLTIKNSGTDGILTNSSTTLTVTNCIVAENKGSGLFINNSNVAVIANSFFTNNDNTGIEIQNAGSITLNGVSVSGNKNGGIATSSSTEILNSSIQDNTRTDSDGGGGIYANSSGITVTIVGSLISGNEATDTSNGHGGGIRVGSGAKVVLVNSTVHGNKAAVNGGGIRTTGTTSVVELSNATISGNIADSDSDGIGGGGGIFKSTGTINLRNTIIADNTSNSGSSADCSASSGITSAGYNFIENITGCTFTTATGDITGEDPVLGVLQSNGGNTKTQSLGSGSKAIDGGNPAGCQDQDGTFILIDQRSVSRPYDGDGDGVALCDIGAFEESPAGSSTSGSTSSGDTTGSDSGSSTASGTDSGGTTSGSTDGSTGTGSTDSSGSSSGSTDGGSGTDSGGSSSSSSSGGLDTSTGSDSGGSTTSSSSGGDDTGIVPSPGNPSGGGGGCSFQVD